MDEATKERMTKYIQGRINNLELFISRGFSPEWEQSEYCARINELYVFAIGQGLEVTTNYSYPLYGEEDED